MDATVGEWIGSNISLSVVMLIAFVTAMGLVGYAFYRAMRGRGERPLE
jgi:hypothetical protein